MLWKCVTLHLWQPVLKDCLLIILWNIIYGFGYFPGPGSLQEEITEVLIKWESLWLL